MLDPAYLPTTLKSLLTGVRGARRGASKNRPKIRLCFLTPHFRGVLEKRGNFGTPRAPQGIAGGAKKNVSGKKTSARDVFFSDVRDTRNEESRVMCSKPVRCNYAPVSLGEIRRKIANWRSRHSKRVLQMPQETGHVVEKDCGKVDDGADEYKRWNRRIRS